MFVGPHIVINKNLYYRPIDCSSLLLILDFTPVKKVQGGTKLIKSDGIAS